MRPVAGAAVVLSLSLAPTMRAADPELTWLDATGTPQWSASLAEPHSAATAPSPLVVGSFRPRLPPLALESLAADKEPIPPFVGKVVVLDFWASWCAPCTRALPELDALWRAERGNGLVVIAVNVGEPAEIAERFAASLGLELPLARWTDPGLNALAIEKLPTVIVLDREGRVRLRLDGYGSGIPRSIADMARELLSGKPEPTRVLAQVLTGSGVLEARFSREVSGSVHGLAVQGAGRATVLATTGWDLFSLDASGEIEKRPFRIGPGVERLVLGQCGAGQVLLAGYRRGGRRLVGTPIEGGEGMTWETSSGLLDVEPEPPAADRPLTFLFATTGGLERVGLEGTRIARSDWATPVWALSRLDGELVALIDPGRLAWLGPDLSIVREVPVPASARVLIEARAPATGCGVAPEELVAAVVGRFTGAGGAEIAVATAHALVVFDAKSGHERFRAAWPDLTALAGADLDGDGDDELLVGSGRRVTALGGLRGPQH